MRKSYKWLPVLLVAVIAFTVSGMPTKAQDSGGVIIEGTYGSDPKTFNPLLTGDTTSQEMAGFMFPIMLGVDPKTQKFTPGFQGGLAKSWEVSKDGLTYTFHLKNTYKWSDGQPVTAKDVEFTFGALLSGKVDAPAAGLVQADISSVKATDDYTLVVTYKVNTCSALGDMNDTQVIPAHVFKPDYSDLTGDNPFNTDPTVTAGVFKFKELRPSEQTTLLADQNYPDTFQGKVMPDGYILKIVPDSTVQVEQLLAGQVNFVQSPTVGRRADLKAAANLQVKDLPGNSWEYVGWNLADPTNPQNAVDADGKPTNADQGHHPLFGDVRVRTALAEATNVDQIIKTALFGEGTAQNSYIVPASWAYDKTLKSLPFDPVAAGKLLDEAGFPMGPNGVRVAKGAMYAKDGTPFEFTLYTNQGNARRTQAGLIVQDNLKQIGIQVDFQPIDFNALLDKINAQTFDAYLLGWQNGYPDDPDSARSIFTPAGDVINSGQNSGSYDNPEVTKLFDQAKNLPGCDQAARATIYKQIASLMLKDQPYMFLYNIDSEYAASKDIKNFAPEYGNWGWNIDTWTVKASN